MTLSEVLNDPIFQFPLESSSFFPKRIGRILTQYRRLIGAIDDEYAPIVKESIKSVHETCSSIIGATDAIFHGNTAHAYELFAAMIQRLEPYITYPDKNVIEMGPSVLFKARRTMDRQFTLQDMFHVPFERRQDIPTSRFSLPGVPCLYLGNSIYTCWEELNRPAFAQMPVSRFELTGKNFRFLDLGNDRQFIRQVISPFEYRPHAKVSEEDARKIHTSHLDMVKDHLLPRYLNAYPLLAASYIKVHHGAAHFKPEYIFPQMVMQWIMTQDDIDGVKYLSTKCKLPDNDFHSFIQQYVNYAIPIQTYQESGYCTEMIKHISLTEPLTYELFSMENPQGAVTPVDYKNQVAGKYFGPDIHFLHFNHKPSPYLNSTFGILEHQLSQLPVKTLKG